MTLDQIEMDIDSSLQELLSRVHEYENVLRFYAKHEHWMGHTEDDESRRVLVAMKGPGEQHGYSYAERALAKFYASAPGGSR